MILLEAFVQLHQRAALGLEAVDAKLMRGTGQSRETDEPQLVLERSELEELVYQLRSVYACELG